MKTFTSRHGRLMGQCTKTAREVSPTEAKRRDLMISARRVATLERKQKQLRADLKACMLALRFERRYFRLATAAPSFEFGPDKTGT